MSSFISSLLKIDPEILSAAVLFTLKVAVFCVPFLLLGLYLERRVDGKSRIDGRRRAAKASLLVLAVAPLLLLGAFNLVNTVRPELLAAFLEKHPDFGNIMVMEGVWPALLLIALVGLFALLNLVEIKRGDTSA